MNSWTSWKEVVGTSLQDGWAFSPSKSKGAKCPTDITLKVGREKFLETLLGYDRLPWLKSRAEFCHPQV